MECWFVPEDGAYITLEPPPNQVLVIVSLVVLFVLSLMCMAVPTVCCCVSFVKALRSDKYKDYEQLQQEKLKVNV